MIKNNNLIYKSSDRQSKDSFDNYSESVDFEEENDDTTDYSKFKARNIP